MAKRKKHVKSRRRRRVGAMALNPSSPLVMLGSVVAGYFGGTMINPLINMLVPASMKTATYIGKAVAAGQVGVGALLIMGKGKKSMIKTVAGGLLAGAGISRAMTVFATGSTNLLGGYGDLPVLGAYNPLSQIGRRQLNGYGDLPVVGGYHPESSLTGSQKVMGTLDACG